jgi:hypothetical protein
VSPEADFVPSNLVMIVSWSVCCSHCVPCGSSSCD